VDPHNPDTVVRGRWYFLPDGSPSLPYPHAFASSNWKRGKGFIQPEIGEVLSGNRPWRNGADFDSQEGRPFIGTREVFANGGPIERGPCMEFSSFTVQRDRFFTQTAVIYHAGNSPPAAPDVSLFQIEMFGNFWARVESGEGDTQAGHFTHIAIMDASIDCRDDYDEGTPGPNNDTLYYPTETGTPFTVRFVEIFKDEDGILKKRAYLDRKSPTWPTIFV